MYLKDIGEFFLVQKILDRIKFSADRIVVGPGDDAFVVKMSPEKLLVVTKDLLVENIHFNRRYSDSFSLGYKSMIVNLSDLVAMGGAKPVFAVVGLALPVDISLKFVDNLYSGMLKVAKKYGFFVAGGDTVSSKKNIVISITLFGEIKRSQVISRKGARVGDLVAVSGYFGDSAAGLMILQRKKNARSDVERYLIRKHLLPRVPFKYGYILGKHKLATSMIDSSDGLATSLKFLSESSKVGMDIFMEKIPTSKNLNRWVKSNSGVDFWKIVLGGGEEYELVFTISQKNLSRLRNFGLKTYVIGKVVRDCRVKYFLNGLEYRKEICGFEHFR